MSVTHKKCIIEGCTGTGTKKTNGTAIYTKGYCAKHYKRYRQYGDANIVKQIKGENRRANPLYKTYRNMYDRCYNANNRNYHNYGAVGITIADEWLGVNGFTRFSEYASMLQNYSMVGYSLDRINPNGNYEPNNLRWATIHQQNGNKRNVTGPVGVNKASSSNLWSAQLKHNGKRYNKLFKNRDDAIRQRHEWELLYLGKLLT